MPLWLFFVFCFRECAQSNAAPTCNGRLPTDLKTRRSEMVCQSGSLRLPRHKEEPLLHQPNGKLKKENPDHLRSRDCLTFHSSTSNSTRYAAGGLCAFVTIACFPYTAARTMPTTMYSTNPERNHLSANEYGTGIAAYVPYAIGTAIIIPT